MVESERIPGHFNGVTAWAACPVFSGISERTTITDIFLLDRDLAKLYGVTTGNLNKAVKRNQDRFPQDFMFQLSQEGYKSLRFQFGILEKGQHSKYLPNAFTEQGVAMRFPVY